MQPFNKNLLVKTVYAYVDLFRKLFPLFLIFFIIPAFIGILTSIVPPWQSMDLFGLFSRYAYVHIFNYLWSALIVVSLNVLVGVGIYAALRKLTLFMKNTFENNPFCKENGDALKFIGIITISLTLLIHCIRSVDFMFSPDIYMSNSTKIIAVISNIFSVVFNPYLILGMFVFLLGEIMLYAAEMKHESDLTV